ncbi:type I toxin-antitoxin system toxin Ldr family protein [Escherichia coli]
MTLAQFAMTFWHDLAAPILAGIITAAPCLSARKRLTYMCLA